MSLIFERFYPGKSLLLRCLSRRRGGVKEALESGTRRGEFVGQMRGIVLDADGTDREDEGKGEEEERKLEEEEESRRA